MLWMNFKVVGRSNIELGVVDGRQSFRQFEPTFYLASVLEAYTSAAKYVMNMPTEICVFILVGKSIIEGG